MAQAGDEVWIVTSGSDCDACEGVTVRCICADEATAVLKCESGDWYERVVLQ